MFTRCGLPIQNLVLEIIAIDAAQSHELENHSGAVHEKSQAKIPRRSLQAATKHCLRHHFASVSMMGPASRRS
eukprot:6211985-Pleurochrysis_carterae.AAC.5